MLSCDFVLNLAYDRSWLSCDGQIYRVNPAVVISSTAYNQARPDIILMAVTSQIRTKSGFVAKAIHCEKNRFNLQTSETIERIARLYAMALDVFIDPAGATRFMMMAHPELEQRSPFETALTELGGRAVEEVIERGLHGLPV